MHAAKRAGGGAAPWELQLEPFHIQASPKTVAWLVPPKRTTCVSFSVAMAANSRGAGPAELSGLHAFPFHVHESLPSAPSWPPNRSAVPLSVAIDAPIRAGGPL